MPEVAHGEPDHVEPLRLGVGETPGLVLGRWALVGDGRDLADRAPDVFRCPRVQQDGQLADPDPVPDAECGVARPPGVDLRVADSDGVPVVCVPRDVGSVSDAARAGLETPAVQAARVSLPDLEHAFTELAERDVVLLDENSGDRQQPASVVRDSEVDRATDVDVADPTPLFGQPDSAPGEHLTHDIGHVLPFFVRLALVGDRCVGLTPDVVHRLHVGDESIVVEEIGRRGIRQLGIRGLKSRNEFELSRTFFGSAHRTPPGPLSDGCSAVAGELTRRPRGSGAFSARPCSPIRTNDSRERINPSGLVACAPRTSVSAAWRPSWLRRNPLCWSEPNHCSLSSGRSSGSRGAGRPFGLGSRGRASHSPHTAAVL